MKAKTFEQFKDIFKMLPLELQERVYNLKNVPQRRDYHPEGNTLKHVITVVNRAIKYGDTNQIIAAIFHDIGKDVTFKLKNGKPTAYGHEKVSAELVKEYEDWIRSVGGDPEIVHDIVKHHMRMKKFGEMRPAKRERFKSEPHFKDIEQFSRFDRGGLDLDENYDMIQENRTSFASLLPRTVLMMADAFEKKNKSLYVVGGAIRDFLQNRQPKDFDLATDALPQETEEILKSAGFKTLPVGKQFGVIIGLDDRGEEFEIATFRKDLGSGRRPEGVEFTDISTDVKRRDLTINALFYDIAGDKIVDLVGGVPDLESGTIRTVGDPKERFEEDRLRKLRAVRFLARTGERLDPATEKALKDVSLEGVSPERIFDEFKKGLKQAKSPRKFLEYLKELGYFPEIFPGLNWTLTGVPSTTNYNIVALQMFINEDVDRLGKVLNQLKWSRDDIFEIQLMRKLISSYEDYKAAYKLIRKVSQKPLSDESRRELVELYPPLKDWVNRLLTIDISQIDTEKIRKRIDDPSNMPDEIASELQKIW